MQRRLKRLKCLRERPSVFELSTACSIRAISLSSRSIRQILYEPQDLRHEGLRGSDSYSSFELTNSGWLRKKTRQARFIGT